MLRHLLALSHVTLEDRESVERALAQLEAGFDLADGLHHARCHACTSMVSFDDRRFAQTRFVSVSDRAGRLTPVWPRLAAHLNDSLPKMRSKHLS